MTEKKIHYIDEVGVLYNNKMEDIIDDLEYDFILTDPPYNIGYKYNDYSDNMNDEDYINLFAKFQAQPTIIISYPEIIINTICEGIGPVSKCVNWCYNSNLARQSRMIAFFNCEPDFKKITQPYKAPKDKKNIGRKGAKLYDWWSDIQLVKGNSKEKYKGFTNQIPIKLLERIIILTTKENDIICDPFSGSGSLYFACKNTNRKYIGIEQSKIHCEILNERLKNKFINP
jgi:DNA modification methylase